MIYPLKSFYKKIIADTITPVSVYLKIRDRFSNSLLLESSDYHGTDNSFSYICFNPIASIKIVNEEIETQLPDGVITKSKIDSKTNIPLIIEDFGKQFQSENLDFKFINNGLFGYISYDAVRYFEDVKISTKPNKIEIPDIYYAVYQNIIAINHFNNEAYIFSHFYKGENNVDEIESLIQVKNFATYSFDIVGETTSNIDDETFKKQVSIAKKHCQRGDVFQLVLSKRFSQEFKGDEFNVYRALRSVNPSPYLFYFDYGDFKIFGSSSEA